MSRTDNDQQQQQRQTSTSTGSEEVAGPSKKELKKLAKKNEKKVKKSEVSEGKVEAQPVERETVISSMAIQEETHVGTTIIYVPANCDESEALKVAIGCALFATKTDDETANVTLQVMSVVPPFSGTSLSSSSATTIMPVLMVTRTPPEVAVIIRGGNAILTYLTSLSSSSSLVSPDPMVEEWLEWEQQVMRNEICESSGATSAKTSALLQYLDQALLLGGDTSTVLQHRQELTSIADVALLSTLTASLHPKLGDVSDIPQSVQHYLDYHASLISSAKQTLTQLKPSFSWNPKDPSLDRAVEASFVDAIRTAFPSLSEEDTASVLKVQKCTSVKNGHYQCNSAMPIFALLKANTTVNSTNPTWKTPHEVAKAIMDSIPIDHPIIDASSLSVTGPGFILCHLTSRYLQSWVNQLVQAAIPPAHMLKQTVVVDFSSPNIAKEMHVGHLRSTIIGESVCRIFEYCGNRVIRMNHLGDWGTQFGMLIQFLTEEYPIISESSSDETTSPNITDLTQFYKNAKQRFDEDPAFKKQSQLNVVALQSGDAKCMKLWKLLCDVSRTEFQKVYDRLGVQIDEYGESFYNSRIPNVIQEFSEKGIIRVEEGGAKCVFMPEGFMNTKNSVPLMLQKSDGGYGYDSTDMAALKFRIEELNADRIIVITDFTQADHFKMCFKAAEMVGWMSPLSNKVRLDHIGFGTVQGEDGKRFKTRSGDTVRLVDLLDEAVTRMEAQLRERISSGSANISEGEVHKTACILGYGAVKYFDLRRNPTSNYIFSYDRMLDTKGNTAIYLLYAHARLESIISKAKAEHNVDIDVLKASDEIIRIHHPSEQNLAFHLLQFADCIEMTLEDMLPYHICDFLYNASIAVSDFVTQCKVLGSPEMKSRLLLCRGTAIVMRQCFDLLGISYVNRI